jgi:class 3 adenylate cyclase
MTATVSMPAAPRDPKQQGLLVRGASCLLLAIAVAATAGLAAGGLALIIGAAIVASGWGQSALGEGWPADAARCALISAETALIGWGLFIANPFGVQTPPPQMVFFSPALLGLLCLLAMNAVSVRPITTWWSGASILVLWTAARLWILADPHTITKDQVHDDDYPTLISYMVAVTGPRYFNKDVWVLQMACVAGCTAILGVAGHRMRRLSREAAAREAARGGLAAHFSAAVVDAMLDAGPEGMRGSGELTILDCDLTGFSAVAAQLSPQGAAELLRLYHGFVERRVFEAGGAVLKFTGDGVTAAFGLASEAKNAATGALVCGRGLVEGWPAAAARLTLAAPPGIAVGIDSGAASWGVVGEGRALTLVVLGEPVEAAAQLQGQTRKEGAALLVGGGTARLAALGDAHGVKGFSPLPSGASTWRMDPAPMEAPS